MNLQANAIFLPIPFFSFVGGNRAVVDIFIKLAENHFVKVVNCGANFDLNQLSRYQEKEITHLYVRKQDYKKFVEHSLKITEVVANSNAHIRQKIAVVLRAAEHVFTEVGVLGLDDQIFSHAAQVNTSTIAIIESNANILDVLSELSKCSLEVARHSMATSFLAGMMVQALRWHDKKTMLYATLGGLLHDVGLCELPHNLIVKPRSEMIQLEVDIYESHTTRGLTKLKGVSGIPTEVLSIIHEHHESPGGLGYPRKIKGDKIFPLSRAVAFADQLSELIIRSDSNPRPKDLKSGIDTLFYTKQKEFGEIFFEAARRLLAYDSIKIAA